jgi:hypothetical protein
MSVSSTHLSSQVIAGSSIKHHIFVHPFNSSSNRSQRSQVSEFGRTWRKLMKALALLYWHDFHLVIDIRKNHLPSLVGGYNAAGNKGMELSFCLWLFSSLYEKTLDPVSRRASHSLLYKASLDSEHLRSLPTEPVISCWELTVMKALPSVVYRKFRRASDIRSSSW